MSAKALILVGVLAGTGYALSRTTPPVPPNATAADSVAVMHAGIGARMTYGVGAIGSKIVGSTVRGMVRETEQSLEDLHSAIKSTKGPDGVRAKKYAEKVVEMNELSKRRVC
jgi:hypothetical protein